MKRRNETKIELIGNSTRHRVSFPKTDIGTGRRDQCFRICRFDLYSDGKRHYGYISFADGLTPVMDVDLNLYKLVSDKLMSLVDSGAIDTLPYNKHNIQFNFDLPGNEGFCQYALNLAFHILIDLGVDEAVALQAIRDYRLIQNQQVKYRGTWMSYTQYLNLTHPLLKRAQEKTAVAA
jgi:hypothetical protein